MTVRSLFRQMRADLWRVDAAAAARIDDIASSISALHNPRFYIVGDGDPLNAFAVVVEPAPEHPLWLPLRMTCDDRWAVIEQLYRNLLAAMSPPESTFDRRVSHCVYPIWREIRGL